MTSVRTAQRHSQSVWPIAIAAVVWSSWLATQFVAAQLVYHHSLGKPVVVLHRSVALWLAVAMAASLMCAMVSLAFRGWRAASVILTAIAASLFAVHHGPVYEPWKILAWYRAYRHVGAYETMFLRGWLILALGGVALILSVLRVRRVIEDLGAVTSTNASIPGQGTAGTLRNRRQQSGQPLAPRMLPIAERRQRERASRF